MRDIFTLFLHAIVTIIRLVQPSGLRSVVAESVLMRHQLLILNRGRLAVTFYAPRRLENASNERPESPSGDRSLGRVDQHREILSDFSCRARLLASL